MVAGPYRAPRCPRAGREIRLAPCRLAIPGARAGKAPPRIDVGLRGAHATPTHAVPVQCQHHGGSGPRVVAHRGRPVAFGESALVALLAGSQAQADLLRCQWAPGSGRAFAVWSSLVQRKRLYGPDSEAGSFTIHTWKQDFGGPQAWRPGPAAATADYR